MSLTFRSKVAKIWIATRLFCAKLFSKKRIHSENSQPATSSLIKSPCRHTGTTRALTKHSAHNSQQPYDEMHQGH